MKKESRKENLFLNLTLNIFIPIIILTRFSGNEYLGPTNGFIVAMALPIGYGLYDFISRRKVNFISVIGFAGVLGTGAVGILELDPSLVAIKEGLVPFAIGLAFLVSSRTRWSFTKKLIEKVTNMEKINSALRRKKKLEIFYDKLNKANYMIAGTFFLSSALNYVLAKMIVVSQPGTVEFNEELGTLVTISYPFIAVPMLILLGIIVWYIFNNTKKLTGMKFHEIVYKD